MTQNKKTQSSREIYSINWPGLAKCRKSKTITAFINENKWMSFN